MPSLKRVFPLLLLLAFCAACAKVQPYRPVPIVSAETAAHLQARSLRDPGLRRFLEKALGRPPSRWPLKTWNLDTLTLAAYDFSPQLQVARASVRLAEAGEITAAERPNPTIQLAPGVPSPWLFGLNFLFPVQTAGKRGYRIAQAKLATSLARLDLAATAWTVRSAVRQALLNDLLAERTVKIMQALERLRRSRVALLRARLAAGEIASSPVEAARIQLANTRLALTAAQGRLREARAALAAAIGIPVSGLKGANFAWPDFAHPPTPASLSPVAIQREAVLNRLDVRRSLLSYAAAEATLRLQIARQYPNFQIGPGYQFEEGHSYFTVGFSTTLPILNRNQGPIAQAEAARKQAAARLLATQAKVIAQSEQALAGYRAAIEQLDLAEQSLNRLEQVQLRLVRRSFQAGESGRLTLNQARLESTAAAETVFSALGRAQTALGKLEDAVQRPLQPGERSLPPVAGGDGSKHAGHANPAGPAAEKDERS